MNKISSKSYVLPVCLALVLGNLAVFWQVRSYEFVEWDDTTNFVNNPNVNDGLSIQSIRWAFTSGGELGDYNPLVWLTHMIDFELYGREAGGHHLTNVLFHTASSILLFLVLRLMTGVFWPSVFVAAVFAIHPLRAESVAWISERRDVMCAFFWILTIGVYARYARRPHSIGRYLAVVLGLMGALLSKSMAVTLPFVLLLLDYWPLGRISFGSSPAVAAEDKYNQGDVPQVSLLRAVVEKVPLLVMVAISSVITLVLNLDFMTSMDRLTLTVRIANTLVSYVKYIQMMLWPVNLAFMYPHPGSSLPLWQPIVSFIILVSISLCVIYLARRYRYLAVGWLWYLGTLVPVIGLVQAGNQALADRYSYLPSIGFFIMFAWSIADIVGRRRYVHIGLGVTAAIALFALLICARVQVSYWKNDLSLFGRAIAVTENNATAHTNYALALRKNGRFKEAIEHYKEAQRINPRSSESINNMARVLIEQGRVEEGVMYLNDLLQLDPNDADGNFNFGLAMIQQDNYADAIKHFNKVLQEKPDWSEAYYCLGAAYYQLGRYEEAIQNFNEALQLNPDYAGALISLGMVLKSQGNIEDAVKKWEKALELEPRQPDAHYSLGLVMAQQGRYTEAIGHFNESLRAGPFRPEAYYWLGVIYYRHSEYELAIQNYNQALRFGPNNPDTINKLAMALEKQGKIKQAISVWRRLLQLEPGHPEANFNLGIVLIGQMKYDEAIKHFNEVLKARPDRAEVYYYLGLAYAQQDNYEQAIRNYRESLRLKGDWVDALNNLAWLLATATDTKFRNPAEAVKLAEQACELTKYEQADLLDTFAVAYAAAGRFSPAIETSEKAIKIAEKTGQKQLGEEILERLQLYKANQPYVERP